MDKRKDNMSDFLFQNISNVFHAPMEVIEIIQQFTAVQEPKSNIKILSLYIPPQKTNQIFTPKWVVKQMVDMLGKENPGCFDMPDKTFIDLYMKSGLYIAEIVKRLYQSDKLKKAYPDETERLKHIFKEQVYGLVPTEIIYKIATNFT